MRKLFIHFVITIYLYSFHMYKKTLSFEHSERTFGLYYRGF